jgi:hypothetical protein
MDDRRRRFEAQVLPHLDAAYRFARRLVRSADDADDVVQEAILRAYRGFDALEATLTIFMRWDRIALLQMTLVGNDSRVCAVAHFELRFKVSCNKRPA